MIKLQMQRSTIGSRRSLVVRATNSAPPPPPGPPIMLTPLVVGIPIAALPKMSMKDAMAFTGPAPETINGRLAMLGFVAAAGAEFNSQQTVAAQCSDAALPILATFAIFTAASFIPIMSRGDMKRQAGPFTPSAEVTNGRAAMVGFSVMLIFEAVSGKAFL